MGAQTFNRYNLFYRLERHLLLHERGVVTKDVKERTDSEAKKFEALDLPPLPSRYQGLEMAKLWFLSSKRSDKKRSHRKSHGVASFTEIARIVASNWKAIDLETKNFVTIASNMLKSYVDEHGITMIGSPMPKKKKPVVKIPSGKEKSNTEKGGKQTSSQWPQEKPVCVPSLPLSNHDPLLTTRGLLTIAVDGSGRSNTPQVNNCSGSTSIAPSNLGISGDNEFVSDVEQSFLGHVLGTDVLFDSSHEPGQPQTITNMLATMTSAGRPRYQRSASLPDCLPSSNDVELQFCSSFFPGSELQQVRRPQSQQRRASSVTIGSCPELELQRRLFQQQRRASTMGSSNCHQLVKELDIDDDEILRMYHT